MPLSTIENAEIEFPTYGESTHPARWVRTIDQMRAEARIIADNLLGQVDHVVTFAPRTQLCGYLFGILLPQLLNVDVDDLSGDPIAVPKVVPGRRTLYVCLPSSWQVLQPAITQGDLAGAIGLHGTGPVSTGVVHAAPWLAGSGFEVIELLGCTETGSIAHRPLTPEPAEPWRLLSDVALVAEPGPDGTCPLHVRSPRIARRADSPAPAETHRMTDAIRLLGPHQFVFVGQISRIININGRRCDLAVIEKTLTAADSHVDAVCVGVHDHSRGEDYELFYASASPQTQGWVSAVLGPLPRPRAVHRVPRIPRNVSGRVKMDRLFAMAYTGSPIATPVPVKGGAE